LVNEAFSGDDEEVERFYHAPLRTSALEAVEAYSADAHNPVRVGSSLLSRIECRRSPEIITIFSTFGRQVVRTLRGMRVRSSATGLKLQANSATSKRRCMASCRDLPTAGGGTLSVK
jgi:hypothetical protein